MSKVEELERKISDLSDEKIHYKSEIAYLNGKIDAYEWFLRKQGFIKEAKNE